MGDGSFNNSGGIATCGRCGRQEYGVLSELREKGWSDYTCAENKEKIHKYTLCPACASLVDSVVKATLTGKSVNIPAVKDYQY